MIPTTENHKIGFSTPHLVHHAPLATSIFHEHEPSSYERLLQDEGHRRCLLNEAPCHDSSLRIHPCFEEVLDQLLPMGLCTYQAYIFGYFRPVLWCYYLQSNQGQQENKTLENQWMQAQSSNIHSILYTYNNKIKSIRRKAWVQMGISLCTAAIEGMESSPGCGCVTSAPKMIVGISLTKGILLVRASTKTVFRPPTWQKKSVVQIF